MDIKPLLKAEATISEAPFWNEKTGELVWVDIPNKVVCNVVDDEQLSLI